MAGKGYSTQGIQEWADQSASPANPEGLKQAAQAGAGAKSGAPAYSVSQLAQWVQGQDSYVDNAQAWYTGRNVEGENNGWATPFWQQSVASWNKAAEEGDLANFYSRPDAYGVVTFDAPEEGLKFGDIVQKGQVTDNVYDTFDKQTADLMMAQQMFDGTELRRIFADSNREERLATEVNDRRERTTQERTDGLAAVEFSADVKERSEDITEGDGFVSDESIVGGGIVGGAVTGAGTGAVLTAWAGPGAGVGAAVGGAIGGVLGGLGAWLNKDELVEQAARGMEITERAAQEENGAAAAAVGLGQIAQFSTKLTSPLGNLTHGTRDAISGEVGDGVSEWYRDPMADPEGPPERKSFGDQVAGWAWGAAGLVSMVGDGAMQFVSPMNRLIYSAQMSSMIGGDVLTLATTGGKLFDQNEAGFDSIFTEDGEFTPGDAAAGLITIGIDAVQTTGWMRLAGVTKAGGAWGRDAARVAKGEAPVEMYGRRFTVDSMGNATGSKRQILTLMAPSEQVGYWTTARKARKLALERARSEGGRVVVEADDLYRASMQMAHGENRLKVALTNAFGEGYEEFVQAITEPIGFNNRIDPAEAFRSFFYGAAGGLGMGLGANMSKGTKDARLHWAANENFKLRYGQQMPTGYWESLSDSQKNVLAAMDRVESASFKSAMDRLAREQSRSLNASELDAAAAQDAAWEMVARDLKKASGAVDDYTTITARVSAGDVSETGNRRNGTLRAEALETSASKVGWMYLQRLEGTRQRREFLDRTVAQLEAMTAPDISALSAADKQTLDDMMAGAFGQLEDPAVLLPRMIELRDSLVLQERVGEVIVGDIQASLEIIYDEASTRADIAAALATMNYRLEEAFAGRTRISLDGVDQDAVRMAGAHFATALHSRMPELHVGSYQAFLGQATMDKTLNNDDNMLGVNVDYLETMGGDFDGDKFHSDNLLIVSDEKLRQIRAGQSFGRLDGTALIDMPSQDFDLGQFEILAEGLGADPTDRMHVAATASFDAIVSAITHRYASTMSADQLNRVIAQFRKDVEGGVEDARANLISALAREAGEKITELGKKELNHEWMWVSQIVRANLQTYQNNYVRFRPDESGTLGGKDGIQPNKGTERSKKQRKTWAVNTAQTLAQYMPGDSLFRKFQHIHFLVYNSPVVGGTRGESNDIDLAVRTYAEFARDVVVSESTAAVSENNTVARTLAAIERMMASAMMEDQLKGKFSPLEALLVMANTKFRDVDTVTGDDGIARNVWGQDKTFAQVMLRQIIEMEKQEHRKNYERNDALKARHAKLLPLTEAGEHNAARASYEIFKGMQFDEILGMSSSALGTASTPEKWLARYRAMDEQGRRDERNLLKKQAEYLDREGKQDIPYSMGEAKAKKISNYRTMVDILLEVGDNEITFDPSKKPAEAFTGQLAKENQGIIDSYRDVYKTLRKAVADYVKVQKSLGRKPPEGAELIQEIANANEQFGRALHKMIPPNMATAVYRKADGQWKVAPWIYEMFTAQNADQALMIFWRGTVLAEANAAHGRVNEQDHMNDFGRRWEVLTSRFQRELLRLASDPDPRLFEWVQERMATAPDVMTLFHELNSTDGVRTPGTAPLLPFVDDVSYFEPSGEKAWSNAAATGDLKANLAALQSAAGNLRIDMRRRKQRQAGDTEIARTLLKTLNNDPNTWDTETRQLQKKFDKVLAVADQVRRGYGPNMMIELLETALEDFDAKSHNKGETPVGFRAAGKVQAVLDAFGYLPGSERLHAELTANSVNDVQINLNDTVRTSGTAMDSDGRQVVWGPMDKQRILELLLDPQHEPLALALLNPSALELAAPGQVTERPVFDNSLKELMDGSAYTALLPQPGRKPSLHQATLYLMIIEGKARSEGADSPVQRYLHNLGITRLGSLNHVLGDVSGERRRMAEEAIIDTAFAHQRLSQAAQHPGGMKMLEGLLPDIREGMAARRASRLLPGYKDTDGRFQKNGLLAKDYVNQQLLLLNNQMTADIAELRSQFSAGEITAEQLDLRIKNLEAAFEENEQRVRNAMDSHLLDQVVAMYGLTGHPRKDYRAKHRIMAAVLGDQNFASRVPGSEEALARLFQADREGDAAYDPRVKDSDWDILSRGAMGVRLADETVKVGTHVSVLSLPEGPAGVRSSKHFRLFDPNMTYLAADLIQDKQLLAAGVWFHRIAGGSQAEVTEDEIVRALTQSVLDQSKQGDWTESMVAQMIDVDGRFDSAAAGPATQMAGNNPKRQAALASATKYTFDRSQVEITEVELSGTYMLEETDPWATFLVTPPGAAGPVEMPLAELNNRYFGGIEVDGQPVPLSFNNMGFGDDPNLRYIALSRLRAGLKFWAQTKGIDLSTAQVRLRFVHPDSMPEGQWNNAYYEGRSGELVPDMNGSLIEAKYFGARAEGERNTQAPLKVVKKGGRAIPRYRGLSSAQKAQLADLEANALSEPNGLAALLRMKTRLALTLDTGTGPVPHTHYNATLKEMKLQHLVVGTIDGKPAALTSEQVIARQMRGEELGLDNPKIVKLSADVVRQMVGSTAGVEARGFDGGGFQLNPQLLRQYQGITDEMLEVFGEGWAGDPVGLEQTRLAHVLGSRQVAVRRTFDSQVTVAMREKKRRLGEDAMRVMRARRSDLKDFSELAAYHQQYMNEAVEGVKAELNDVRFSMLGVSVIAAREKADAKQSAQILAQASPLTGYERVWRFTDTGTYNPLVGALSYERMGEARPEHERIIKGDRVLLHLSDFTAGVRNKKTEEERVSEVLEYLVNTGAEVVLVSGDSAAELRYFAASRLEELNYTSVAGSKHIFGPVEYSSQTQNQRAYESTLRESRTITPMFNSLVFLTSDPLAGIRENAAILGIGSTKLNDVRYVSNMLPTGAYDRFGLLQDNAEATGPYARALDKLLQLTDPDDAELMMAYEKMSGEQYDSKAEGKLRRFLEGISRKEDRAPRGAIEFVEALARLRQRVENGQLYPSQGDTLKVGDIIPFVDDHNNVIFYRHGMELPDPSKLHEMFQQASEAGVALGPSKMNEGELTTNEGTIALERARSGYGRELVLKVPLQPSGDKIQLEYNGMKYIVVRNPEGFWLPESAVLGNGTVVDLWSNLAAANSKQAYNGRIANYRNALTFFGFDHIGDMVEFFYPNENRDDPNARRKVRAMLQGIARNTDIKIPTPRAASMRAQLSMVVQMLKSIQPEGVAPDWVGRLESEQGRIPHTARAVLTYLMTPGAELADISTSDGFAGQEANFNEEVTAREVPGLFADLLTPSMTSPAHLEFIEHWNTKLQENADGSGYYLTPWWEVEAYGAWEMKDGRRVRPTVRGYLQFGQAFSSGDNPTLNAQAFDRAEKQDVSLHNALGASGTLEALTAAKPPKKSQRFLKTLGGDTSAVRDLANGSDVWEMLTDTRYVREPKQPQNKMGWGAWNSLESARARVAREEIVGYHQLIDDQNTDWFSEDEAQLYNKRALRILTKYGLHDTQRVMVDTWVRMRLGKPHAVTKDGVIRGQINGKQALQELRAIEELAAEGRLPVAGGLVPLMPYPHLATMFLRNENRTEEQGAWAPKDENGNPLYAWDEWVNVAFGTSYLVKSKVDRSDPFEPKFLPLFRLSVDGFMHEYQRARADARTTRLPVTMDMLRLAQLVDPDNDRMLVSVFADENLLATDPVLLSATKMQLEDAIAGQRVYALLGDTDATGNHARRLKEIDRWAAENDIAVGQADTLSKARLHGQLFLGRAQEIPSWARTMYNLRAFTTLADPTLVASAPLEALVRRTVDTFAGLATLEGVGVGQRLAGKIAEALAGTSIGDIAQAAGLSTTYSTEEMKQARQLIDALASRPEFLSMVFREIYAHYPVAVGLSKLGRLAEKGAKAAAIAQDPTYGMLQRALARRYLENAMRKVASDPVGSQVYSIRRLLTELARDPEWLRKNDHDAHMMGLNGVANQRSIKPNLISTATRSVIEPLTRRNFAVAAPAHVVNMMMQFQNFWSGFAINITGMQAAHDFMTFWFDGKPKKLTKRFQRAIAGDAQDDLGSEDFFNMDEILESADLADAFIKGGVTHSGLFMFGMAAAGLGLSGEDDEEKWRRRQAALQGGVYVNDPNKLQSDFRNRDAIYLDYLPSFISSYFRNGEGDDVRSVAQMHWIARTFLSPILGFERFYETGNLDEIRHGFIDAIGSHPIVNQSILSAALNTSYELEDQMVQELEQGGPENMPAAAHLAVTMVGTLERMLFENAFINSLYIGFDDYDRNPYAVPKRDSDGNPQVDLMGNPIGSAATTPRVMPDGTLTESYVSRSAGDAQMHVLTENRATLAAVSSLFFGVLGKDTDYFRYQQPVKTRKVELKPTEDEVAQAYLRAAFVASSGQRVLSESEIASYLRKQVVDAGGYYNNTEIEADAARLYKQQQMQYMSEFDELGREVLTLGGDMAIFEGLWKGTLKFGDDALQGVFITKDQRDKIQEQWTKELVAEGIEMGLDKTTALSRMKRIWFGEFGKNNGLSQIVYDFDNIPAADTLEYSQLNTTYVIGPDGRPWATGFARDGLLQSLGVMPLKRALGSSDTNMGTDSRLNSVDLGVGINTGLRALQPREGDWEIPTTEEEIRAAADKIVKAIEDMDFGDLMKYGKNGTGSNGWYRGYSRYGGGGRSYGGGGYSSTYFTRMYELPNNISVYGNNIPFINTSNPIIRRADVRRERVWSERGRLKQWQ